MEEGNESRQEKIRESFKSVADDLEQIRAEYHNVHMELKQLIQKLQDTEEANYKETLFALTVMETNMEEYSLENFTRITNSLQIMKERFSFLRRYLAG